MKKIYSSRVSFLKATSRFWHTHLYSATLVISLVTFLQVVIFDRVCIAFIIDFSLHVRYLKGYLVIADGYYLTPFGRHITLTNKIHLSLVLTNGFMSSSSRLPCYQWAARIKIRGTEQVFGNTVFTFTELRFSI